LEYENIPTPKYDELKRLLGEFDFEKNSKEYKMFEAIITAFGELESDVLEHGYKMDELDEDLADVEEELYIGDDEFDEVFDEAFEDDEVFELQCPHCSAKLYIDEAILLQDKMNCPNCGKEVEFDLDDDGCGGSCNECHGCE